MTPLSTRMVEAAARALSDISDMGWQTASEYQRDAWREQARAALTAALALAEAEAGAVFMRWPPDGDDVQACADEVNPYAETTQQYGLTVEMVCDIIEAWKRRAPGWRPIETAPRDRKMVALIARYPDNRGWTDPWNSWWDTAMQIWPRWPHPFPPTHYAVIPTPPAGDAP